MTGVLILLLVFGGILGLVARIIGVLFFGPVTHYLFQQAVQPGPASILAAHGFTDHASAIGVGLAALDAVEAVSTTIVMDRTFAAVKLRDS